MIPLSSLGSSPSGGHTCGEPLHEMHVTRHQCHSCGLAIKPLILKHSLHVHYCATARQLSCHHHHESIHTFNIHMANVHVHVYVNYRSSWCTMRPPPRSRDTGRHASAKVASSHLSFKIYLCFWRVLQGAQNLSFLDSLLLKWAKLCNSSNTQDHLNLSTASGSFGQHDTDAEDDKDDENEENDKRRG